MSLRINRQIYHVSILTNNGCESQEDFYSKKKAEKLARYLCKQKECHTTISDSETECKIVGYCGKNNKTPIYETNFLMEFKFINGKVIRVKQREIK